NTAERARPTRGKQSRGSAGSNRLRIRQLKPTMDRWRRALVGSCFHHASQSGVLWDSFRPFYALNGPRNGLGVPEVARNIGTSVQVIEEYYAGQTYPPVRGIGTPLGRHAPALTAQKLSSPWWLLRQRCARRL